MTNDLSYAACDEYMSARQGKYDWRAVRYRAAADFLSLNDLSNSDTVCDVGAGWTEFDYCLRKEYDWRGRYMPLDAGLYPIDLNHWVPERPVEFYAALEILEHLDDPARLLDQMVRTATKGIAISVPNPRTVDVLGIDATHVSIPDRVLFESRGFFVEEKTFYGGVFSNGEPDSLFAVYTANDTLV